VSNLIALAGSGEYLDVMSDIDRRLLAEAGKDRPRVVCLPTAAGQEGPSSIQRWSEMGIAHFRKLGAEVEALPVIDRSTAEDPRHASRIRDADLIYFSGGDPGYLYRTLANTPTWESVESACRRGAAVAGCSAGAMILGEYLPDRFSLNFNFAAGFGWIARCLVLPHFDRMPFRSLWLPMVRRKLTDRQYALGVDENTALVGRIGGDWEVMGAASVSILTRSATAKHSLGSCVKLP